MIKGVNKNVIEISDTGNECFERAILFVRPDRVEKDGTQMRRRAVDYLAGIKLRPWFYPRGKAVFAVLRLLCAAAGGAAIATAFLTLW